MNLDNDSRFYMQTNAWQKRFKALNKESPESEWMWIVKHYQGDQDDLDHLINLYKGDLNCPKL